MINGLVNLLLIILSVIVQISFLTTWPVPISSLNLILILVIFLTVIIDYHRGLWWALGSGLLLELYIGSLFGITALSLMLMVIIINFLFNNFFTNRSFYSLMILGFIGTISYNLLMFGFNFLALIFGANLLMFSFDFWFWFFWQPALNLLILAIIFFTYYVSTGKLKNIFLFPSNL